MIRILHLLLILATVSIAAGRAAADISLQGNWHYKLDSPDRGEEEKWFDRDLEQTLVLPGSIQCQGIGDEITPDTKWVGNIRDTKAVLGDPVYKKYASGSLIKIPSWLQPLKYYQGAVWYQREVELPPSSSGEWLLELERVHWQSTLYIDGRLAGSDNSLGTPHRYVLKDIKPGKHRITIRVDNRLIVPVGIDAHSVSDHTQSNWNGIVGNMRISALKQARFDDIRLTPDVKSKSVKIDAAVRQNPDRKTRLVFEVLTLEGKRMGVAAEQDVASGSGIVPVQAHIALGDKAELWDENNPCLYQVQATFGSGSEQDRKKVVFGLREFKAEGTRFVINGLPVFLRGTLECCVFPETGYPPTDEQSWEKIYSTAKAFGLNHIRFHSWCPPKAAFDAADRTGIYLQVECGVWSMVVGDDEKLNQWIQQEGERILKEYGNHPSFCLMAHGNEPSGHKNVDYLTKLVNSWKTTDTRRVYTGAAGWPYIETADYWNAPDPRIQAWGQGLNSRINAKTPSFDYDFRAIIKNNMPTVSHEIGQWCVYPDFREIEQYTGVLKAKNFELFREILDNKGMSDLAGAFLFASGKLQTLCYKADIEAALRTPGMAGFQLLGLTDFPGQGTALVGVLNAFWKTKGYVDAEEFREFCSSTVPLVRFPRMVWNNKEVFSAPVEIAHFGPSSLKDASLEWKVFADERQEIASGNFKQDIAVGNAIEIGTISFPLDKVKSPGKLIVEVIVKDQSGKKVYGRNTWNIWVYPSGQKDPDNKPYITHYFDEKTRDHLSQGGSVLLTVKKGSLAPENGGNIAVGFSPIFWNTAWTNNQAPHTLGIYCNPAHPALAAFPNDGYSDWQWWDIIHDSSAIVMDSLPREYRPIIHHIDDWFINRKLGFLMEMKVGSGKLVICGADLEKDLEQRPAARQFRHSLLQYMSSPAFNPAQSIPEEDIKRLLPAAGQP